METILLIDEERESTILIESLKGLGYRVIGVPDGPSALSAIGGPDRIDLVITECRLPGMGGLELLRWIRLRAPALPVIIVTACGSIETYLSACSLGAFEYVSKPVEARELSRILKAALKSSGAGEQADRAVATCDNQQEGSASDDREPEKRRKKSMNEGYTETGP